MFRAYTILGSWNEIQNQFEWIETITTPKTAENVTRNTHHSLGSRNLKMIFRFRCYLMWAWGCECVCWRLVLTSTLSLSITNTDHPYGRWLKWYVFYCIFAFSHPPIINKRFICHFSLLRLLGLVCVCVSCGTFSTASSVSYVWIYFTLPPIHNLNAIGYWPWMVFLCI